MSSIGPNAPQYTPTGISLDTVSKTGALGQVQTSDVLRNSALADMLMQQVGGMKDLQADMNALRDAATQNMKAVLKDLEKASIKSRLTEDAALTEKNAAKLDAAMSKVQDVLGPMNQLQTQIMKTLKQALQPPPPPQNMFQVLLAKATQQVPLPQMPKNTIEALLAKSMQQAQPQVPKNPFDALMKNQQAMLAAILKPQQPQVQQPQAPGNPLEAMMKAQQAVFSVLGISQQAQKMQPQVQQPQAPRNPFQMIMQHQADVQAAMFGTPPTQAPTKPQPAPEINMAQNMMEQMMKTQKENMAAMESIMGALDNSQKTMASLFASRPG